MDLATVILDAATTDSPSVFTVNTQLREVDPRVRVRELLDRQLHVFDSRGATREVTPLPVFAERII